MPSSWSLHVLRLTPRTSLCVFMWGQQMYRYPLFLQWRLLNLKTSLQNRRLINLVVCFMIKDLWLWSFRNPKHPPNLMIFTFANYQHFLKMSFKKITLLTRREQHKQCVILCLLTWSAQLVNSEYNRCLHCREICSFKSRSSLYFCIILCLLVN